MKIKLSIGIILLNATSTFAYIDWNQNDPKFNCRIECDGAGTTNPGGAGNYNVSSASACNSTAESLCGSGGYSVTYNPPISKLPTKK